MNLKRVELFRFGKYKDKQTFYFDKINVISGNIGTGKSTLGVAAINFCIHGYSDKNIDELGTRGEKKEYYVESEIEHNNKIYIIKRSYPTYLEIKEDGIELDIVGNEEKQRFLNKLFGDIHNFKKFRMIDNRLGINILEKGDGEIKKTLFNINEDYFNTIKSNLATKKRTREIYNRDKAVAYIHSPSEKRLNTLEEGIEHNKEKLDNIHKEIKEIEEELANLISKKSRAEESLEYNKHQKDKIAQYSGCPTCRKKLDNDDKVFLLEELNRKNIELNDIIASTIDNIINEKEVILYLNGIKNKLSKHREKLLNLKIKLEGRLKQKEYIWTNSDVLIIKKAIEELDSFYSYYIVEWIKILEPIINNIVSKINFKIRFDVDEKKNISLKIIRDNKEFTYQDLSSGEKLIVAIAFKLALLIEKQETGLIIADEGFSNLDNNRLLNIIDLFRELPFQLIMILHRFDNIPEDIKTINL